MKIRFLIVVFFALFTTQGINAQNSGLSAGDYYIKSQASKGNDGYWGVYNLKNSDRLRARDRDKAEKFRINKTTDGYYTIAFVKDRSKVVDVDNGSGNNGTDLLVWKENGQNNQKYRIFSNGDGSYTIQTYKGQAVCLDNNKVDAGTVIQIWDNQDRETFRWIISTSK